MDITTKKQNTTIPNDKLDGKILMHNNVIVDDRMLDIGIYATSHPKIHYQGWNIEQFVEVAERIRDLRGDERVEGSDDGVFSDDYIENLKKCELVDVEIIIKK